MHQPKTTHCHCLSPTRNVEIGGIGEGEALVEGEMVLVEGEVELLVRRGTGGGRGVIGEGEEALLEGEMALVREKWHW